MSHVSPSWSSRRVYGVGTAGWVYRVGIQGGYRGGLYRVLPSQLLEEQTRQRSGPRKPCRGWSGWPGAADAPADGDGPVPTLRARSVPLGPPWYRTLQMSASWPIWARFDLISCKVSQNLIVSPEYDEKASHSPYFQNGLRKSPLDFLGFPYSLAFSHKELIGPF